MSDIALFYTTFADRGTAERVAETLLSERLVACVNILAPCASSYRWEGRIERAEEVPVLLKTRAMSARRLRERLEALHPYELPVIESWTVETSAAVAGWIGEETG